MTDAVRTDHFGGSTSTVIWNEIIFHRKQYKWDFIVQFVLGISRSIFTLPRNCRSTCSKIFCAISTSYVGSLTDFASGGKSLTVKSS